MNQSPFTLLKLHLYADWEMSRSVDEMQKTHYKENLGSIPGFVTSLECTLGQDACDNVF